MKKYFFVTAVLFIFGCSSAPKVTQNFDSNNSAKIRINHPESGTDIVEITDGDLCDSKKSGAYFINASKSTVARFKKNISLGMPKTESTSAYYGEYLIPSDKTISIMFITHKNAGSYVESCRPVSVSFDAETGGLYEASMNTNYGKCSINIGSIKANGNEVIIDAVPTQEVKSKYFVGGCKF